MEINYFTLKNFLRFSIRKKLWNNIDHIDKAFYLACLKLSKIKQIKSKEIIDTLKSIISKINSFKEKIMKIGNEVAKIVKEKIVKFVPEINEWIKDKRYIFWLGITQSRRLK